MVRHFSLSKNQNQQHCAVFGAIFVFPATGASEKLLSSENRFLAVFKGTGVVLAGIECSPKIKDFRASGIPVQERGDFVDTLKCRTVWCGIFQHELIMLILQIVCFQHERWYRTLSGWCCGV